VEPGGGRLLRGRVSGFGRGSGDAADGCRLVAT
jgi:hypothetical protein